MGFLASGQASASLIINGDFALGNTGFASDYEFTSAAGGLATGGTPDGGAQKYAIGTNPNYYHSAFVTTGDHTSGQGNMMIVNGSTTAGKEVWRETVGPLMVGTKYEFSAWVMNVYPDSPANLKFSFGGTVLGEFSPTGSGVWQQFTAQFTASEATSLGGVIDLNLAYSGNDFALDDISLTPVPEPSTVIAGALLLLPFGATTLRLIRKNGVA